MGKYCFGIDVGGTTVKLGLFTENGEVIDKWEIVTDKENNGEKILPDIAKAVLAKQEEKNIKKEDIRGLGIGVPGPVTSDGKILKAANLGWGIFNVEEALSELTGLKVKAGNDANVAALGEMWKGGGKGFENIVMITLGTGVGGGVINEGKIVTGANGAGGEIGHIHVEDDETDCCGCGNRGCLEQYASATGVVRLAKKIMQTYDGPSLLKDAKEITAKTVFDAVKQNDELACQIAEKFGKYLGEAMANVAVVVNPQAFVIGGGVSKAGEILIDYIKKYYMAVAFSACKNTEFTMAQLGNDAGIYGAAKLVL